MAHSMDPQSTMGRYGVLHYVKSSEPAVVASYPIDIETVNLGRDVYCDIRMWYGWVSHLHCKVIFENGKAFLEILGENGVVVDGSPFFPSPAGPPTTVPLTNGSEFEIFNRRFIFQYPPKDQRAKLLATPRAKSRKSLRLSMINSAVVFTPGPSSSAEENWAKLQSPVKPFQAESIDDEVTVVEGDQARVLQFDKDLIVLEEVDAPPAPPSKPRKSLPFAPTTPLRGREQRMPSTTPRRRFPLSLHKAVLVRNSQRALIEAQEESEVLEAVSPERVPSTIEEDEDEMDEDEEDPEGNDEPPSPTPIASNGIRASLSVLGSMLPFVGRRSVSPTKEVEKAEPTPPETCEDQELPDQAVQSDSDEEAEELPSNQRLGAFMTPQTTRHTLPDPRFSVDSKPANISGLDLNAAKRRMSHLGRAQRPTRPVTQPHDELQQPTTSITQEKPAMSVQDKEAAAARRLTMLEPDPELPHPSTRRQSLPATPLAMRTTETPSSAIKSAEERLVELQRTVDSVTQRDTVRESRRSFVSRDMFTFLPSADAVGTIDEETPNQVEHMENEDQDVEMKDEAEERSIAALSTGRPTSALPSTPSFKGMRELFKSEELSKQSTPSFAGVRGLFRPTATLATPSFAGLRDIFRSPVAPATPLYSGLGDIPEDGVGREDLSTTESHEEVAAMLSPDQLPSAAAGIAIEDNFNFGRLSLAKSTLETFHHTDIVGQDGEPVVLSMGSDATETTTHPDVQEADPPKATRKVSGSRIKTPAPAREIPTEATSRSSRKRGQSAASEAQQIELAEASEHIRSSRRGAKVVAGTEDPSFTTQVPLPRARKAKATEDAPSMLARRPGRSADVAEDAVSGPEPQVVEISLKPTASTVKGKVAPTRAKRGKAAAEDTDVMEVDDVEAVVEETSTSRTKRTTKGAQSADGVVAAEPLAKPKARATRTKPVEQAEATTIVKPRATRAKPIARDPSPERKAETVSGEVSEDVEMVVEEPKPVKRAVARTTKAVAAKTKVVKEETEEPTITSIPRMAKKAVGGKKATTAPILIDDLEDKENSADHPMEELTTGRSRTTTTRTTRKVVKTEVVDEPVPRATRTRARK